jgi:hypothetical protein
LGPLLHSQRLRAGDIEQRGNVHLGPFGDLARRHFAEPKIAEKRHQHCAAAFHAADQRMADNLHLLGPGQIGNFTGQHHGIKSDVREEIEIDRLPMPEPQRQSRSA